VQPNARTAFDAKVQWASTTFNPGSGWFSIAFHSQVRVADANGDGQADIVGITDNYVGVQLTAGANGWRAPDRIAGIDNGLEIATAVIYRPLTDQAVYVKDTGSLAAQFPTLDVQPPLHVVSSFEIADGTGGTRGATRFYVGAKVHLWGRGFLGFRWVESTDVATNVKSNSEFRQDWPYVGLPSVVKRTHGAGAVLSETTNTFSCIDPSSGAACTVAAGSRYFPYASQSVEVSIDLNGAPLPTVTTTTQYDAFGNATSVVVSTGDGYSKATTNTYSNDTGNWFLGRLIRSSVQSTAP
jgi:hypothetical protein